MTIKLKPETLAMILAGGRVDELNVLTYYRPKSAVPFGGFARVIDFPLSNLMHSGLERVAILSQYRSFSLINHIGSRSAGSGSVPAIAPHRIARLPTLRPSTASPTAAPSVICVTESIVVYDRSGAIGFGPPRELV